MNFESGHVGPFWMSPTQREAKRHDIQLGTTSTNERNRSALELDLKTKGINTKGKNKKELVQLCVLHEIPSTVITVENFREGWEGRVKGLLQVLWERGFIDSGYSRCSREVGNYDWTNDSTRVHRHRKI